MHNTTIARGQSVIKGLSIKIEEGMNDNLIQLSKG